MADRFVVLVKSIGHVRLNYTYSVVPRAQIRNLRNTCYLLVRRFKNDDGSVGLLIV